MSDNTSTDSINRATIKDFWQAILPYKRESLLSLCIPVSAILNNTLVPFYIGKILASLAQTHGQTTHYVIALAITMVFGLLANVIGFYNFFGVQPKIMAGLDKRAFTMLMQRSAGFHNNRISGKLVTDTIAYSNAWQQLSNATLLSILPFVLSIIIGIGIVTTGSWQLGIVVLVMTLSVVGIAIRQTIRASEFREQRHEARRTMIAHLSDTIINNQTVKIFAGESREVGRHNKLAANLAHLRTRDFRRLATDGSKRIAVLMLFEIAFVLVIIKLVHDNPALLAIGIFTFSYAINLGNRLFEIGSIFRTVEDAFLEAGDITELLHDSPEILDTPGAKKLQVKRGAIEFNHVAFAYDENEGNEQIFKDLTLHIKPGERIGLVGSSGGGKSTLTRLLLRFSDIQSGQITIDEQDIAKVTQSSLREAISYVPQEPLLFHRTIGDNIAYGSESASRAQIEAAAKQAYAYDFIASLPDGFDTIVGERGVKLSGGQRQRVAIARAILKNAPILLLDEATSALDSESEIYIQSAMTQLMQDRTAIVIAHRLSTIQKLDRIIVLDNGTIIEQGSHSELLARKGAYAKLWGHQSGGFIED